MKKVILRYILWILIGISAFAQIFQNHLSVTLLSVGNLLATILNNVVIIFISLLFGYKYYDKKIKPAKVFIYWFLAVITSFIVYVGYWIRYPQNIDITQLLHIFLPVLTSSSPVLAGLLGCILIQPKLYDIQSRITIKQNLIVLVILMLLGFITSAGKYPFNKSIYGLYVILFFAWGMFLAKVHVANKIRIRLIPTALISLIIMFAGVYGFYAIYWYQRLGRGKLVNWNYKCLINITSPLLFVTVLALFLILEKAVIKLRVDDLIFFIPIIIFMQLKNKESFLIKAFLPNHSPIIVSVLILLFLAFLISILYQKIILNFTFIKKVTNNNDEFLDLLTNQSKKIFNWTKKHIVIILTPFWLFILSFCSYLIESDHLKINMLNNTNYNAVTYLLANKFETVILTTIFLVTAFTLVYLIFRRYWSAIILVSALTFFWSLANKVKLSIRGNAILPADLNEIINAKTLINMVNKKLIILSIVIILFLILLDIFLEIKYPIKLNISQKGKLVLALLCIAVLITPIRFNHKNSVIYYINKSFGNNPSFNNSKQDLQQYGPILTFLDYVDRSDAVSKPSGYSKKSIEQINKKYRKIAQNINKNRKNEISKQTIVFNLSESFIDPYTFPKIKFRSDFVNPIKYICSLKHKSTYGMMLSSGYGGGTGDMEWETLTGLSMGMFNAPVIPFVQIVPKYTFYPTFGMNFKYSSAIHPFNGTYYSRIEDYQRFKFNKFIYVGSKYSVIDQRKIGKSPYNSDFTAYNNGISEIKKHPSNQFMNIITIQNHMPYNNWYSNNYYINKFSDKLLDKKSEQQMATYLEGLKYTDQAVQKFIKQIDKINKPITFIFYGDHYPQILSQNYENKYPIQMHSTRYFIYANKYARKHGVKSKLTDKTAFVSASNFIAMTLEQTNSKVTPYQALLTQIWKELPVVTVNYNGQKSPEFINQLGHEISAKHLNKKQKRLLKDYELIQYDMTDGDAYSVRSNGFYN